MSSQTPDVKSRNSTTFPVSAPPATMTPGLPAISVSRQVWPYLALTISGPSLHSPVSRSRIWTEDRGPLDPQPPNTIKLDEFRGTAQKLNLPSSIARSSRKVHVSS